MIKGFMALGLCIVLLSINIYAIDYVPNTKTEIITLSQEEKTTANLLNISVGDISQIRILNNKVGYFYYSNKNYTRNQNLKRIYFIKLYDIQGIKKNDAILSDEKNELIKKDIRVMVNQYNVKEEKKRNEILIGTFNIGVVI